jgi:hypothetical protein
MLLSIKKVCNLLKKKMRVAVAHLNLRLEGLQVLDCFVKYRRLVSLNNQENKQVC